MDIKKSNNGSFIELVKHKDELLSDVFNLVGINHKQAITLLDYMNNNKNSDNQFFGNYKKIIEETGISHATTFNILKKLQEIGFVEKLCASAWEIKFCCKNTKKIVINYCTSPSAASGASASVKEKSEPCPD